MSFFNGFSLFANQLHPLVQKKPGVPTNLGSALAASKAFTDLAEVVKDNKRLTTFIEVMQLAATEAGIIQDTLIEQNTDLRNGLAAKETYVQQLINQHKAAMEKQRVQHDSELATLRNELIAEHHTRLHLALEAAKVEHATQYLEALNDVQDQKRYLLTLQTITNAHRSRASQLATSLADANSKLVEMEDTIHHLTEAVHKQTEVSNTNFQELLHSRETIDRMRVLHSNLLQKRDDQIFGLQEKVDQLKRTSDNNTGRVTPDYYNILGVGRNADINELQMAYRRECRKHHPDKHRDSSDQVTQEAIFKTMKYGYEVLKHPGSRTKYDQWLEMKEVRLAHQHRYCWQ